MISISSPSGIVNVPGAGAFLRAGDASVPLGTSATVKASVPLPSRNSIISFGSGQPEMNTPHILI